MNKAEQFFLYCSGIDTAILEQCPSDKNKYIGIGGTVFFTGLLASLSGGYAIYTVFDNYFLAALFGLVWGLMIFNLDRYIVSSMKSRGSWFRDFGVALPRMAMAVLLALVISKPLELKIFEKEINAELVTMEQEVYQKQEQEVRERFEEQIAGYQSEIDDLQAELTEKAARRDTLSLMALREADGTGGSGKKNLGPIYRAKKADADAAQQELEAAQLRVLPIIENNQQAITGLQQRLRTEIDNLQRSAYGGLAARMEALDRLGQESQAIFLANIFIMLLFIAIETAPIFVKLISYRSPYDHLLHTHEHGFRTAHDQQTALLNNATKSTIQVDTETSVHRTEAEIAAQKELIDHFAQQRKEAVKYGQMEWKGRLLG